VTQKEEEGAGNWSVSEGLLGTERQGGWEILEGRGDKGIWTILLQWRARDKHIHKGCQATSITHTHTHSFKSAVSKKKHSAFYE